jgi:hypothetical protein
VADIQAERAQAQAARETVPERSDIDVAKPNRGLGPTKAVAGAGPPNAPGVRPPGGALAKAGPGLLVALQRSAGNGAVSRLVAGEATRGPAASPAMVSVQRLSVTAADLDRQMGSSRRGVLGVGESSYANIRSAVAEYQAAKQKGKTVYVVLGRIEKLCLGWLNSHRKDLDAQDTTRRTMVEALYEEATQEQLAFTKKWSQDIYLDSLTAGAKQSQGVAAAAPVSPTFRDRHKFKGAAGTGAKVHAADAREGFKGKLAMTMALAPDDAPEVQDRIDLVTNKGLTPAEAAAILTYTTEDYKYINAATANSLDWMDAIVDDASTAIMGWKDISDKDEPARKLPPTAVQERRQHQTLREEGGLHAAMAVEGLKKLDPYTGAVYRGQNFSAEEFRALRDEGTVSFSTLLSTSKNMAVPIGQYMGVGAKRPVVVLWVLTNHGGRDVQLLSVNPTEAEVLLFPGTTFTIRSVIEVPTSQGKHQRLQLRTRAGAHWPAVEAIQQKLDVGAWKSAAGVYVIHAEGTG